MVAIKNTLPLKVTATNTESTVFAEMSEVGKDHLDDTGSYCDLRFPKPAVGNANQHSARRLASLRHKIANLLTPPSASRRYVIAVQHLSSFMERAIARSVRERARGRFPAPLRNRSPALFHVDCFAVWVERTVDANLLALILFCQILAVDIV